MVNRPTLAPETDLDSDNMAQAAWIVFQDETDLTFLKILRRGFRHCFMMIQQEGRWILIDPRANKTDIHLLPHPKDFNFPRYYTEQGKIVVKIPAGQKTPLRVLSPFPVSCVTTLKRVIGLHRFWIFTPYQLYKHLLKTKQKGS